MSSGGRSIVHVASEMAPLAKVGGLADVVGALAAEQARRGHRVLVVLPAYRELRLPEGWTATRLPRVEVPWGMGVEPADYDLVDTPPGHPRVLLVRHAGPRRYFDRAGIYDDPRTGQGWADNTERFLFFSRAAAEGLARLDLRFDIVHAHDHQAAFVPCFARTHLVSELAFARAAMVFTIHNLGYQGITDSWVLGLAGFGGELFYATGPFEFWGRVNFMKVGLSFADMISTVSPRYAEEIQASGEFGLGLEGVLQRRTADVRGILNGIDEAYWNPATDPYIAAPYDVNSIERKAESVACLASESGFPRNGGWPIVGMVTRLVEQKGIDLVEEAADELLQLEARFVILGSGQQRYMDLFRDLAATHADRFSFHPGFDEPLAHRIEAGSNLFLMPSRYEPCGLNQMYSLRYGTPPVVRAVGGLADSVRPFDTLTGEGTGFRFQAYEAEEMVTALRHAIALWRQPGVWRRLQANGMRCDFSWKRSADRYDELYAEAGERVTAGRMMTLPAVRAIL